MLYYKVASDVFIHHEIIANLYFTSFYKVNKDEFFHGIYVSNNNWNRGVGLLKTENS